MRRGWRAWLERVRSLRREGLALYFAARDSRVPWYVRALAFALVVYVFSPIDLIPDFIPIVGLLDDVVIVAGSTWLILHLTPREVIEDSRARARALQDEPSYLAGGVIVAGIWVALAVLAAYVVARAL